MNAPVQLLLGETAVGACDDVLTAHHVGESEYPLGHQLRMSTTFVPWLTTPGANTLPSGSLTSFQTCHSCSWRGFAASMRYAPALTLRIKSTIFLKGTSLVCGPGQLPQQT